MQLGGGPCKHGGLPLWVTPRGACATLERKPSDLLLAEVEPSWLASCQVPAGTASCKGRVFTTENRKSLTRKPYPVRQGHYSHTCLFAPDARGRGNQETWAPARTFSLPMSTLGQTHATGASDSLPAFMRCSMRSPLFATHSVQERSRRQQAILAKQQKRWHHPQQAPWVPFGPL